MILYLNIPNIQKYIPIHIEALYTFSNELDFFTFPFTKPIAMFTQQPTSVIHYPEFVDVTEVNCKKKVPIAKHLQLPCSLVSDLHVKNRGFRKLGHDLGTNY